MPKGNNSPAANSLWARNNLFNRVFNRSNILEQQIRQENLSLANKIPLRKMFIDYATGKDANALSLLNHNPEYISPNEGTERYTMPNGLVVPKGRMQISENDAPLQTVKVNHPGKYTTLINTNALSSSTPIGNQIKALATNDFVSHALHGDKNYEALSGQLGDYLKQKYSNDMIQGNGGVDAYMRGIYDESNPEYEPYRKEMSHIPANFIQKVKGYIKKGK